MAQQHAAVERLDYMPTQVVSMEAQMPGEGEISSAEGFVPSSPIGGTFRFAPETHEMYPADAFPWQDQQDIAEMGQGIPWG